MITEKELRRLVNNSIEYTVNDGILTIRDYFTGRTRIDLDLRKLTVSMVNKLQPDYSEKEEER